LYGLFSNFHKNALKVAKMAKNRPEWSAWFKSSFCFQFVGSSTIHKGSPFTKTAINRYFTSNAFPHSPSLEMSFSVLKIILKHILTLKGSTYSDWQINRGARQPMTFIGLAPPPSGLCPHSILFCATRHYFLMNNVLAGKKTAKEMKT
jgi:hypothetical protein